MEEWHRDCTPAELLIQLNKTDGQIEHTVELLRGLNAYREEIITQLERQYGQLSE